ncbi:MAG TPA: hypothetical protein VF204_09710 [Streptosporangiaceae bacterium]
MELSPFRIERFYARYEHTTRYMLSSSDCESRTIGALLELEPGAVYDQPGHVRIGFGRANMPEALEILEGSLPKP